MHEEYYSRQPCRCVSNFLGKSLKVQHSVKPPNIRSKQDSTTYSIVLYSTQARGQVVTSRSVALNYHHWYRPILHFRKTIKHALGRYVHTIIGSSRTHSILLFRTVPLKGFSPHFHSHHHHHQSHASARYQK